MELWRTRGASAHVATETGINGDFVLNVEAAGVFDMRFSGANHDPSFTYIELGDDDIEVDCRLAFQVIPEGERRAIAVRYHLANRPVRTIEVDATRDSSGDYLLSLDPPKGTVRVEVQAVAGGGPSSIVPLGLPLRRDASGYWATVPAASMPEVSLTFAPSRSDTSASISVKPRSADAVGRSWNWVARKGGQFGAILQSGTFRR